MRTCLALLALTLPALAVAQPQEITQTAWQWERTDTSTVYIDVDQGMLKVWRRTQSGQCSMYPSRVRWEDGDLIQPSTGNRWEMKRKGATLMVTFPKGTTIRYEAARMRPTVACDIESGREI